MVVTAFTHPKLTENALMWGSGPTVKNEVNAQTGSRLFCSISPALPELWTGFGKRCR